MDFDEDNCDWEIGYIEAKNGKTYKYEFFPKSKEASISGPLVPVGDGYSNNEIFRISAESKEDARRKFEELINEKFHK